MLTKCGSVASIPGSRDSGEDEDDKRGWREEVPGVAGFGVALCVDADEAKPLMDDEGQRSGRRGGPWP